MLLGADYCLLSFVRDGALNVVSPFPLLSLVLVNVSAAQLEVANKSKVNELHDEGKTFHDRQAPHLLLAISLQFGLCCFS